MAQPYSIPAPILDADARPITAATPVALAVAALRRGQRLRVTDRYGTGADVLDALAEALGPPPAGAPFPDRRAFRQELRRLAMDLLAPVRDHRVALHGAGAVGFLPEFYPETPAFELPFPVVQELHGAWRRYDQGVRLPVLGGTLHPFWGTYAPTRTEHLELFATWLSSHEGSRGTAVDVGTGSGVLAMLLAKAGFPRVIAIDQNPNAVESVRREVARDPRYSAIDPRVGDLLNKVDGAVDLIVFNPPWITGATTSSTEEALYAGPDLMPRFFDQALDHLAPEGKVVVVYSNINQLVRADDPHPVEVELDRGRFSVVQRLQRRIKSKGRRTRERVEVWELGVGDQRGLS